MTRRRVAAGGAIARLADAAIAGALAVACAAGGSAAPGSLLLADQGSIVRVAPRGGNATLIVAPVGGNGVALRDPALSPDGRRIAYVRVAPGPSGRAEAALWVAATGGGDPHPVLQAPGVAVAHPQWLDDRTVAAVVRSPSGSSAERVDAATGARSPLVGGALDLAVSPDRARLATVRQGVAGPPAVVISDAAGGEGQPVADVPAWNSIEALAFAPDSRGLAVAAPQAAGAGATQLWLLAEGAPARLVATLPGPVSGLAFAPDGATLYALTATALDGVTLRDGAVRRVRGVAGAGTIAGAP